MAQATGKDPLLEALDLSQPDMSAVKVAMERGDTVEARAAFARHLRTRTAPRWFFDPAAPPKDISADDLAEAARALQHTFDSVGIRHTFGPKIDWAYNPTTQPGSPWPPDHEWTWQLNRHVIWRKMAAAYSATGDARYAQELTREIADWIRANPPPGWADQNAFSRWRTIDAGIRMFTSWPYVFYHLVRHPDLFPDDVLLSMVDSMRRHADYLDAFPTTGNWLCLEANGEFHVGALFPELKNAARWRQNALHRLRQQLEAQVYPDGAQIELTPGYHNVVLLCFVGTLRLARLNAIPLPDGYQAGLEKMYALNLWAMSPDRDVPPLNDSWRIDVPKVLREGVEFFPTRKDWAWIASEGKEGQRPDHASHLFPYAGWALMRSGWDRQARFLLMDGGPFGYAHQHEDKLSFVLHAFGTRLVFDAGSYAYDASAMRQYVLSARGHNVIHVDGLEQHRGGLTGNAYVAKAPVALTWQTAPEYDYAAASFGTLPEEGWGPSRLKQVVHTRRILFVKPDYWIVLDTLTPSDAAEHTYESTFHLDTPAVLVDEGLRSVVTQNAKGAQLGIFPLPTPELQVRIIQGQEQPFVQGWLPREHALTGAFPRPCVYFTQKGKGTVRFLYVFAPAPEGHPVPVLIVTPGQAEGAQISADIAFRDGQTHRLRFHDKDGLRLERGAGVPTLHIQAG